MAIGATFATDLLVRAIKTMAEKGTMRLRESCVTGYKCEVYQRLTVVIRWVHGLPYWLQVEENLVGIRMPIIPNHAPATNSQKNSYLSVSYKRRDLNLWHGMRRGRLLLRAEPGARLIAG